MKKNSFEEEDSVIVKQEVIETAELLKDRLAKESKKITRIPYYKLEELKKIEEKKLKNFNKTKKKEEHINNHIQKTQTNKIKKSKKQREEDKHQHQQHKANNNENDNQLEEVVIEKKRKASPDSFTFLNDNPSIPIQEPNQTVKPVQTRKHPSKRAMRLSKKQQMIQNPTYSLGQFMSSEDKMRFKNIADGHNQRLIYNQNESKGFKPDNNNSNNDLNSHIGIFRSNTHKNILNGLYDSFNQQNAIGNENKDKSNANSNSNVNNTQEIINDNMNNNCITIEEDELLKTNSTDCLQKKRKRITKYKKAVYKYRIKKKQFLYQTVFEKDSIDPLTKIEADSDINHQSQPEKREEDKEIMNDSNKLKDSLVKNDTNENHNQNEKVTNDNQTLNYINANNNQTGSRKMKNQTTPVFNYYYDNNNNNFNQSNYPFFPSSFNNNSQYPYHPYMPQEYSYQMQTPSDGIYNNINPYWNIPINQYFNRNQIIQTDPNNKFSFEYGINANTFYLNPQPNNSDYRTRTTNPINQITNVNNKGKRFAFEMPLQSSTDKQKQHQSESISMDKFKEHLKETYNMDIDINELNGKELNDFLQKHKDITKINLNQIQKYLPKDVRDQYMSQFEGLQKSSKKIVREYVDQILDKTLDGKFSQFIEKLRDLYYKKKTLTPLKAKKRFVVGMREIEKFIRLKELLCLFVVPNIEKVTGKNSLDDRLKNMFNLSRANSIPVIFGLNKFKLGKISRKKVSCVSMIGIINVEGFEKELKELIEYAEKFKEQWYLKYYDTKGEYETNQFISFSLFEHYQTKNKS